MDNRSQGHLPVLGPLWGDTVASAFNFTATVFGPVGYLMLLCVILVYIVVIFVWLAIERRAIRDELSDEVRARTITSQEYAILPSYFRRTGLLPWTLFTESCSHGSGSNCTLPPSTLHIAKRLARRTGSPGSIDRVMMLRRKILDLRDGATVRAVS